MPRKEKIHDMFNNIAVDYDKLNHIMSLDIDKSWRKRALKRILKSTREERRAGRNIDEKRRLKSIEVLDVACGTGDFSIAIAEAMNKMEITGHVTGVDLSEGMLEVMKGKVAKAGLEGVISCETGDCENLRFTDGSFDRVTVAFGVRNFENREKGLKEMLRVLRPGGKLVILELSVPSNAFLRWLFNLYFLHILPLIGGKISGDKAAYKYLPASVLNFPGKKEFTSTLWECGYAAVSHKAFTLGICRMYTGIKP
ncbi:MAG: bifunctional demethylmenaquinone methyltransferase/2-methoxy-6-polyprenyl-1,4-benzoquinol methylase UbiE [Candidatus Cryptobacteroides sp.]